MAYTKKTKDADDVLDYTWGPWTNEFGADDTVVSATFTVTTQTGGEIPASDTTPVEVDSFSNTDTHASAWLSGGTTGSTYLIICHAVSAAGREGDKTLQLKITPK